MVDALRGGDRRGRRGAGRARAADPRRRPGGVRRGRRAAVRAADPVTGAALWRDWFAMIHAARVAADPDGVRRARAVPDRGVRGGAGLRPAAGRRVGPVRAGRDRRRADAVDGRPAAAGRARRTGPRPRTVYTGELYDAATLERWNVVNRVLPDDGFADAAHAFALRLANGPTRAHAATKAIVRDAAGRRHARPPTRSRRSSAARCSPPTTCSNAVASFLRDGPGKATYTGR